MRFNSSTAALSIFGVVFAASTVLVPTDADAKRIRNAIVIGAASAAVKSATKSNSATSAAAVAAPIAAGAAMMAAPTTSDEAAAERARRKLEAERGTATTEVAGEQVPTIGTLTCIAGCYGRR
jgi:hypothetical protein